MPEDLNPNNLNELLARQNVERSRSEFVNSNAEIFEPDSQALYNIGKNAAEAGSKLANISFKDDLFEFDLIDSQNNVQRLKIKNGPGAAGFFGNFKITDESKKSK